MVNPRKLILYSTSGYRPELNAMIEKWIEERIEYIGIVGSDVENIYDAFEEALSYAYHPGSSTEGARSIDGSSYFMWPMAHRNNESLQEAIVYAQQLTGYFSGPVTEVVEF